LRRKVTQVKTPDVGLKNNMEVTFGITKKVYWSRHYKLQPIKIVILYPECLRNNKTLGDWLKTQYTSKLQ